MHNNSSDASQPHDATRLTVISKHILDIIDHLRQVDTTNSLEVNQSNDTSRSFDNGVLNQNYDHVEDNDIKLEPNQNSIDTFSLLLIGDEILNEGIIDFIDNHSRLSDHLEVNSLPIEQFLKMPFNRRYDLGCLISKEVILNQENNAISLQDLRQIAIRLRDLFAHQSLIFTPTQKAQINYNNLGFTPVSLSKTESTSDLDETQTQLWCWQFNLYDYKRQPDWLNARFWANPENFNKYRW